jgi:hypothetical protein
MEVSINGGTPSSLDDLIYNGKSQSKMDDEWGYPQLRKLPYYGVCLLSCCCAGHVEVLRTSMGEGLLADLPARHGFGPISVDLTKNMEVYNQP